MEHKFTSIKLKLNIINQCLVVTKFMKYKREPNE